MIPVVGVFSLNSRSQNFERTLSASVQSQIELLLEELDDAQQGGPAGARLTR